ncbi:MAG: DUF2330 domain-containing protein [Polyangiales bacterium]
MLQRHASKTLRAAVFGLSLCAAIGPSAPADAFCGFYVSGSSEQLTNKATRVALMREGTRTVLSMSNDYDGPAQDFAMVVPVPIVLQRENVRTLPHDVFQHLEGLTAPRLVEYWEQDPCAPQYPEAEAAAMAVPTTAAMPRGSAERADLGVRIEAQFTVGEYDVVVLSATQSTGLETWLHLNHYNIPTGAAEYMAPYVREQWKFFVAKVDIARVQHRPGGGARLSPLRFHYDAQDFRLPVRLGLLNAGAAQDLIVYILHPSSRFEVANYPNVFIPTNLDVADSARRNFGELYARLFDYTMEQAGGRAVVTEYAWGTNSCDPCPTPPLQQADLATLGADVLGQGRPGFDQSYHVYNMNVTRLHTRYSRATLTEDLIFQEASAVVGGREFVTDQSGRPEQGARPAEYGGNNFQARYAIRHPWTGPIRCAHPIRGRWGGPPDGHAHETIAARDLAEVPRGQIRLSSVIRSPIPPVTMGGGARRAPNPVAAPPPPPPPPTRPVAPLPNTPVNNLPPGFTRPAAPGRPHAENDRTRNGLAAMLTAVTAGVFGMVFLRRRKR